MGRLQAKAQLTELMCRYWGGTEVGDTHLCGPDFLQANCPHHSYFLDQLELQSGHALFGLDYQITMQLLGNKADFRNTRAARQLCSSLAFEITEYKLMLST